MIVDSFSASALLSNAYALVHLPDLITLHILLLSSPSSAFVRYHYHHYRRKAIAFTLATTPEISIRSQQLRLFTHTHEREECQVPISTKTKSYPPSILYRRIQGANSPFSLCSAPQPSEASRNQRKRKGRGGNHLLGDRNIKTTLYDNAFDVWELTPNTDILNPQETPRFSSPRLGERVLGECFKR